MFICFGSCPVDTGFEIYLLVQLVLEVYSWVALCQWDRVYQSEYQDRSLTFSWTKLEILCE